MGHSPAILQSNIESNAIDVTPASDASAGVAFFDPISGLYVIGSRDIVAGSLGAASNTGHYRLTKEDPTDVITAGTSLAFGTTGYIAGADPLVAIKGSGSGDRYVLAELNPVGGGGGGGVSVLSFSKMTSTEVDNTQPIDTDWPGANPPLNGLLEIERLPQERDRRELWVWGGASFARITENLKAIVEVAHGLDLTTVEGQRVPVAWFYDGTISNAPTGIEQVNHFAVRAPDANTLVLRVASDMDGRTYSGCTNAIGALGETMFWNATTKVHVQAPGDLRLFQVGDTDPELIKWDMEDTRSTVSAADVVAVVEEWVSIRLARLVAGNEIPFSAFLGTAGTVGDVPLPDWPTDANIEVFAGGVVCSRLTGFSAIDCVGTVSGTGISFNSDLLSDDAVYVRRYGVGV